MAEAPSRPSPARPKVLYFVQGNAALYGLLARLPERGQVSELVLQHFDQLYRPS